MHAHTSYCCVGPIWHYGFLFNSCCAVVCLQSKWQSIKKNIESIDTKFQVWLFPSFNHCCHWVTFVAINSKTSQVDENPSAFFIFTDLTRFQGPKEAMYQSVGKCFRIHLRAASIHISNSDSDSDAFIWIKYKTYNFSDVHKHKTI